MKKQNEDVIIDMDEIRDTRVNKLKRQAKVIGNIAKDGIERTITNQETLTLAATVGLVQGLKYKGDFKRGAKAGLATVAVFAGVEVARDIMLNKELIKNA